MLVLTLKGCRYLFLFSVCVAVSGCAIRDAHGAGCPIRFILQLIVIIWLKEGP